MKKKLFAAFIGFGLSMSSVGTVFAGTQACNDEMEQCMYFSELPKSYCIVQYVKCKGY